MLAASEVSHGGFITNDPTTVTSTRGSIVVLATGVIVTSGGTITPV